MDPTPNYYCKVCLSVVRIVDNKLVRRCEHSTAPVVVQLKATAKRPKQ